MNVLRILPGLSRKPLGNVIYRMRTWLNVAVRGWMEYWWDSFLRGKTEKLFIVGLGAGPALETFP